ncbi:DUF3320 domain-containing protein [Streptomyces rectiverticillatus]|uniref:DUF3320 domain-containing protein n=1 Tax=Streptomyces rectiverticillatus TaxID=173860 RepID=UPI001FECB8FA|nr:DUF3320 domain-containing protein [Streptomyces rectiverticillatus]
MSGRNRLLNFRHTKAATLEILSPSADTLCDRLGRGWDFAPLPEEEPLLDENGRESAEPDNLPDTRRADADGGIVTQKKTSHALLRALRNLRSKSVQIFNDYGLWTLQLGVGMLHWRDDGAHTGSDAPLVLLPVRIERLANGRMRLRANEDEEPRLNPALKVKLEQFGIDWTPVTDLDPLDITAVLEAAARAVEGKAGWAVSSRAVVALFASHKESMYQDLLDNEERVVRSDLVRALALGPDNGLAPDRFDFEEIDLDRVDELSPPEDSPLVLDADASQRQAIAAAVAGRSFVLDGPPGTGKSQTITNMIAGLMHAGRTVLFVSEKAAALDVVLNRLKAVGLDSYALALHSHNTARQSVARELGRALTEEPQAPGLADEAVARAREARQSLSAYADAMNEVREPLRRTLHDVIGRVGQLSEAPVAYLGPGSAGASHGSATFRPDALDAQDLEIINQAAQVIAGSWDTVADPDFPWRDLRPDAPHPRPALEQAVAAREALAAAVARYRDLSPDGEPIDEQLAVDRLIRLLGLLDSRVTVPESWLTTERFADAVQDPVDSFLGDLSRTGRARDAARIAVGVRWQELSPRLRAEPGDAERALRLLSPAGLDLADLTEEQARAIAAECEAAGALVEHAQRTLAELCDRAGVEQAAGLEQARSLCTLLATAGAEHRPPAAWLTPGGVARAETAATGAVADGLRSFFSRRDRALSAQALAVSAAGPGWRDVPAELSAEPSPEEISLAVLEPRGADVVAFTRPQAERLAERFQELSRCLDAWGGRMDNAADLLGMPRPRSVAEAEDLIAVIDSAAAPHRCPGAWLDPEVLPRVRSAVTEIVAAAETLRAAEAAARDTFADAVVSAEDLPETVQRLAQGSRGVSALLSSRTRADRKFIAHLTHGGAWRRELYAELPRARDWYEAHRHMCALATGHAGLIGDYATADLPDVEALRDALAHAETVHRLAPDAVAHPRRRARLAAHVAAGRELGAELRDSEPELRRGLERWKHGLEEPDLDAYADDLAKTPPAQAAAWLRAHMAPLRQAVALLGAVSAAGGDGVPEHTLASARTAIVAAHAAQRETAAFDARAADDMTLLGPWYRGLETDPGSIDESSPQGITGYESIGQLLRRARDGGQPEPSATSEQRNLLGRYADGDRIDTAALCGALESADLVARLVPATLADPARRSRLADVLADGALVHHELLDSVAAVRRALDEWEAFTRKPHLVSRRSVLLTLPLSGAAAWLRAHVEPLEDAADLVHSAARAMGDRAVTLTRAREAVAAVMSAREAEARFREHAADHRNLLGPLYRDVDTDRHEVRAAVDWAQEVRRTAHGGHAAPLSTASARMMLTAPADASVTTRNDDWRRQRDVLVSHFAPARADELRRELARSLEAAHEGLARLDEDRHGPEAWTECAVALDRLGAFGLGGMPRQLTERRVEAEAFPAAVERAVLTAWIEHHLALDARLKPVRATERDQLVDTFRAADRDLVEAAHAEVISACNARRPRRTSVGQAAVIRREAEKKRRHMPVRRLLAETREVAQLTKPCLMMSPLTVSQFLPMDFTFDVVIFDEASQVLPQDAVNSVYRGRALIVAGDQKQLPPTSFFSTGAEDDDEDEWDENAPVGFESVLDICKGSGVLRSLSLRWHYRSRHENLIAFSNHEFYEGDLITFPGALEQAPDIGVEFIKADGVYDRGGQSNNPIEAATVAQRVIHHFTTRPHLTLGVVALSKAQAETIEEELHKARAGRPDLDQYFTEDRLDGFFVKNLETVQGDERDVIILSVGYGPDQKGRLLSTFGPLNKEGGWRRLNVAVTRARRRMEVVASFHGGDLKESTNGGVRALQRYLEYAANGPRVLRTEAAAPDAGPESPFEEEVFALLRGWGYSVQPQVGVAGYRIDMAIRHPDAPGTYALGIECDGAMYHSSRAARDRDRLRESVLRELGWRLHRIWGTDWYRNRRDAMERLRAAVEAACVADPHASSAPPVTPSVESTDAPVTEGPPEAVQPVHFVPVVVTSASWSRPYQEAETALLAEVRARACARLGVPGIELQDPGAAEAIAEVALCAIEVEGPVEEEMIFTRVRTAWGLNRAGQVVRDRIQWALRSLARQGKIVRSGTAYDRPGREIACMRTPTPECNRKVGLVPAVERRFALCRVVDEGPGTHRQDLIRETARLFGWTRIGPDIRHGLTADIDALIAEGRLVETESGIMPVGPPPGS